MERYLSEHIKNDLKNKLVILSGPRQCGKTYLSKHLNGQNIEYFNYDIPKDRLKLLKQQWSVNHDLMIFDEIHKMKKWKSWLKGIVDDDNQKSPILVTGSAKLDTYKKVGDSLAGRYFSYRLFPFDLKEIAQHSDKKVDLELIQNRLLTVSGFPEPYINGEESYYTRWQQTHLDIILKQDILETESVRSIKQIETLAFMLTERVASLLSYNSMREDLNTDDKSVKRWIDILENSFVVFRIYPYVQKSIIGGLRKSPKLYYFDYCRIENSAARFENYVALALFKEICFRKDALGKTYDLNFLKNKQDKEIDFLITKNKKPHLLIEVKESDDNPSENFRAFEKYFPEIKKIQIVKNANKVKVLKNGIEIHPAALWLSTMDF